MIQAPAWEQGSSFPIVWASTGGAGLKIDAGQFFGSGRQALIALVLFGRARFGWERLIVPTYYCPEVVEDLSAVIGVERYPANPFTHSIEIQPARSDVILVMSYFGEEPPAVKAGTCIVDATHDPIAPWLERYRAAYVVASLRKTLPLPDGAVVWSPSALPLPEACALDTHHRARTSQIVRAMSMKASYLAGHRVEKDDYLSLFRQGERSLRGTRPVRMSRFSDSAIPTFPVHEWRRRRLENIAYAYGLLAKLEWLETIPSSFGVVLRCRSHYLREGLKRSLIEHRVYPAVLWPLACPEKFCPDMSFSQEMLFVHADFRWTLADMKIVVDLVRQTPETSIPRRQDDRRQNRSTASAGA